MLPVVLGLCWWWMEREWLVKERQVRIDNALLLAPFFAISGAASVWTIWEQKYANHALGVEWSQTWAQRAVVAGKDIWFYLWKLAWPHPLTFIYPVWNTEAARVTGFLPLNAVVLVMLGLWMGRNRGTRGMFFATAYFVISLFPVLSFFNVYFFRYSFVGDHFQYLASIGPLALAGAALAWVAKWSTEEKRLIYPALCGALLVVLAALTFLQTSVYYNLETLWRCTLADNPDAWIAQYNLAGILVKQGRLDEAIEHYQAQLRLLPRSTEGRGSYANVLVMQGKLPEAVEQFHELLRIDPNSVEGHAALSTALLRMNEIPEAISEAQQAVELSRHTDETGEGHNDAMMLQILAMAYARGERYPEAVQTTKMAIQRAESQGNAGLEATLQRELGIYEAAGGKP